MPRVLPLKLYQITEKYRDEKRPRFGLLRGREFLMKDLYTFDADEKLAEVTYEEINNLYTDILNYIGVKFARGLFCIERILL
jgi:prolyl-tRNA synthetase